MRDALRTTILPFCAVLFPTLHFIGRNLTSESLPPRTDPTISLLAGAVAAAVVGAAIVAVVVAQFRQRGVTDERSLPRYRRMLQPDDTALAVDSVFALAAAVLLGQSILGVSLPWIDAVFAVIVAPAAVPFLVLAPLAIEYYWAVVLAYVLSVLWAALLATYVSDLLARYSKSRDRRREHGRGRAQNES